MTKEKQKLIQVSEELANQEFDRFVDSMDLDLETENSEDAESLEKLKRTIIKAIMKGSFVVDDNGIPTFTPQRSVNNDPIVFDEPTGRSLLQTDGLNTKQRIKQLHRMLAHMTKTNEALFANMKNSDYKVCQAVFMLFFG